MEEAQTSGSVYQPGDCLNLLTFSARTRLACSRLGLASLLVRSGPNSEVGQLPALDPKSPMRTFLINSINKHRLAGSHINGDRYFIYEQIYARKKLAKKRKRAGLEI